MEQNKTEEIEISPLEEFVEHINELDKIKKMEESRKDLRPEFFEKADEDIAKYAFDRHNYNIAKKVKNFENLTKKAKPEDLNDKEREFAINFTRLDNQEKAASKLYEKADEIASELSPKSLEYLVAVSDDKGNRIIKKYVESEKDKKMYDLFEQVVLVKNVLEKFKKGDRSEDVQELYKHAVVTELAEDIQKSLKEAGYSINIQKLGMNFAVSAFANGRMDRSKADKYAEDGLNKLAEKAEKLYHDYSEKENGGRDIYSVVRENLAKGARDESPENFNKVFNAVYGSIKEAKDEKKFKFSYKPMKKAA